MKMAIVSVRDIKADAFGNPVFTATVGTAIRSFADEVNKNDGNPFAAHPEDFELYHVGNWAAQGCEFDIFDKPVQIALGSNVKVAR